MASVADPSSVPRRRRCRCRQTRPGALPYQPTFVTSERILLGIREGIGDAAELDVEYMDAKRNFDAAHLENFKTLFAHKLTQLGHYDVVIASDDIAFDFAVANQRQLLQGTPVVFLAVNNLDKASGMVDNPGVTGVVEAITIGKNFDLALSLWPDIERVIAVVDNTESGISDPAFLHQAMAPYPQLQVDIVNLGETTWDGVGERLRARRMTDRTVAVGRRARCYSCTRSVFPSPIYPCTPAPAR